ncbi:MAG: GWxTD domain-containing protein [Pseudarcicella sp.]|nr:GWxTD domain-containing protein [Pseudarcicella sp.]MBP6410330.1 GWxTD domain-containing protein [Pseudarcicella sp.]
MLFFSTKKILLYTLLLFTVLVGCTSIPKSPTVSKTASHSNIPLEPQRFFAKSKFLDNGKNVRVYLSVHLGRDITLSQFKNDVSLLVNVYADYTMGKVLLNPTVSLDEANMNKNGEWVDLWFDFLKIPNLQNSGVVITEIIDNLTKERVRSDMVFKQDSKLLSDNYLLFRSKNGQSLSPVLHNYVAWGDTLVLKSMLPDNQQFKGSVFAYEFEQAMSPMSYLSKNNSKTLTVDSVFQVQANVPFVLKSKGLIYFSRDSSDHFGISALAVDERFPRITYPEKLLKPLVYMSTNAENYDLKKSKDYKNTLDKYWLNLPIAQVTTASQTIKEYYKRVEEANQMYSTYKEGWKTDKGMVWIIMGNPFRIAKSKEKEVWTYQRNGHQVSFNFFKRMNQFSDNHYELQRNAEFQSVWFPMIEHWRNGELTYLK